ncbi:phage tail tape measure protein [Shinella yambaruensis]|uniref:Phage tail tape measure protein domain-containing protein n=1 Tax=Shinella yambaruensis TaxID=415996 RepID=A0ABQ5ZB10_9HYPH|nr:phage tail tape measure protein [Shinella yambaruensis]MCJ8028256.1 phage tail tape measure protein [Shinella yambaruensis]MCU7980262.1 phage tail tape measure protein [Shinella yambaruensis]GLR49221.1 hypothetical protein GCM10007923_04260 [Shinella yambaruensis]
MSILKSTLRLDLLDGVTGPARRIQGVLAGFQRQQTAAMAPLRGVMGQVLAFGGAYLGVTKGISSTAGAAIKFEEAFADVRKVLDANDEQMANVRRSILAMSREMPIAAEGIAAIYAAAGQNNIPLNEINQFAEMVAKVSVAWDTTQADTGQALAEIKNQLHLSVREVGLFADSLNHLSNNTAANAPRLLEYTKRVAATGEMFGFSAQETLAFGGAMIASGGEAEVAATSFRNMGRALTIGTRATKSHKIAFGRLGLDATKTAKNMQKNALKTTLDVIERIQTLPEWERISIASALFGDEARALMPLINNSTELRRQLGLVGDQANYAGSAFKEYMIRADTVGNALAILRNKVADVFRGIGDDMLPGIKEAALGIGDVIDTLGERASVFDQAEASLKGFLQGLGYDGGIREAVEGLGDLLFGEVDGDGAADKLGRIFKQFEGYGQAIRQLKEDLKDNPIAQFFIDLGGQGFKLMLAAVGIGIVAGAITKLGRALAFLTGITTAIGILKSVAKIGGILKDVPIPNVTGDGKNKPTDSKPSGWGTGWRGLLAMFQMFDAYTNMPSTKEGVEELYKKNREGSSGLNKWLDARITTPSEWFRNRFVNDNSSHPYLNKDYDDGGRAASMDAYLGKDGTKNVPAVPTGWPTIFDKRFWIGAAADPNFDHRQNFGIQTRAGGESGGSPRTTSEMLGGLNKPITLDAGTIGQLLQPTRGVQEVREVNKQPPVVTVHAPISITGVSSPEAAADAAASRLGQAVKSAVEAADTD